jgi:beta-lactamase regulating signal transducer with metallopeptidase domain
MTGVIALTDHPAAVRLGLALVHFLWQGAALAFIAVILVAVLRNASAGARYLGLLIVFAAMAACPVVTFALTGDAPARVAASAVETFPLEQLAPSPPPVADTGPPPVTAALEPDRETSSAAPLPHAPEPWVVRARQWAAARLPWVTLLWLTGVAVLSLRLLTRWWAVGRVRGALESASADWQHRLTCLAQRLTMRRPVRLLTSAASRVPMVIGWLRPVIVIPTSALVGLTPDQLAAILAHELAHIRRFDHLVNLAQTAVEILLFYHPAVWWVSSAIRAERENCCDDVAVRVSGDVVAYMRALAWIEQNRAGLPEPAIASSGTSLLSRIRRLAGSVSLPTAGYSWLAAAMALGVVMVLPIAAAVSGLAAGSESGQHGLGAREQWQPQTESDPRLQQPVRLEILGRAAAPGLELLSKQTGVSLQVAPEDLETVGERKLTIIAQACTLKALMAQIPNALQECHWDIDRSGSQPVYLLHRNGSAESAMVQAIENDRRRTEEAARPERTARVEAARKALAMSPAELEELAQTDPLLAAAAKDPEYRERMEIFFSLPQAKLDEFLSTGVAGMALASAPPRLQAWATKSLQEKLQRAEERSRERPDARFDSSGFFSALLQRSGDIGLTYDDVCLPYGFCPIELCISPGHPFDRYTMDHSDTEIIPPRTVNPVFASMYRDLLLKTGTAPAAADAVLGDLGKQYETEDIARRDHKREVEWREPRNPALQKVVVLPFTECVDPVEVLRFVAKETGLSVVSDYFDMWGPLDIPEEARTAQPIWRLLYLLSEGWSQVHDFTWFRSDEWNEAGDCLVFHDRGWYYRLLHECPESLISTYREKLKRQGHFTLEDVAAFAAEYHRRKPVHPKLRTRAAYARAPRDLRTAGLQQSDLESPLLLIHATLSPAQREKARSAAGLAYAEMTAAQHDLIRPITIRWHTRLVPDAEIPQAVYRVTQSGFTYKLVVEFPNRKVQTALELRPVAPQPAPADHE